MIISEWLNIILLVTNALTIAWAIRFRMRKHKKVDALAKLIREFERNGEMVIRVESLDPAHFFLRSPN